MGKNTIKELVKNSTTRIQSRLEVSSCIKTEEDLRQLIALGDESTVVSTKAIMILEVFAREHIKDIFPYFSKFCNWAKLNRNHSENRCLSKIFYFFCKKEKLLIRDQKMSIVEISFEWPITSEKTATQVFSMQNIAMLKDIEPWIADSLKAVLSKNLFSASPGYQSRARKILSNL